jgi:hypothetical protein
MNWQKYLTPAVIAAVAQIVFAAATNNPALIAVAFSNLVTAIAAANSTHEVKSLKAGIKAAWAAPVDPPVVDAAQKAVFGPGPVQEVSQTPFVPGLTNYER